MGRTFEDLTGLRPETPKFQTATFTEFWCAYESGTLIELMDSKGLKEERSRFPYLEAILSDPPSRPRPSVWDLKQFIAIKDPAAFPPMPTVEVDYGFINCQTHEDSCTLMEIYKRLLQKGKSVGTAQSLLGRETIPPCADFSCHGRGSYEIDEELLPSQSLRVKVLEL